MIKGLRFLATTFLIGQSYASIMSSDEFGKILKGDSREAIRTLYNTPMSNEDQSEVIGTRGAGEYFRAFESFVQTIMDDGDRYDKEMLSGLIAYKLGGTAYETIYKMALLGYRFEKLPVRNYYPKYSSVYKPTRQNNFEGPSDLSSEEHQELFVQNKEENLSEKSSESMKSHESDIGSIHEVESELPVENKEPKHKGESIDDSSLVPTSNLTKERKNSFDNKELKEVNKDDLKLTEDLEEKIDKLSKVEPVVSVPHKEEVLDESLVKKAKELKDNDIQTLLKNPEFFKEIEDKNKIKAFVSGLSYEKMVHFIKNENFTLIEKSSLSEELKESFADQLLEHLILSLNSDQPNMKPKDLRKKEWFQNMTERIVKLIPKEEKTNDRISKINNLNIRGEFRSKSKGKK